MSENACAPAAARHLMNIEHRLPVTMVSGSGCRLKSSDGKDYLDLVAGIAVNLLGYSHPKLVKAICDQARELINVGDMVFNEPMLELVARLVELTFPARVFFCHSGAEANEAAIKLARKWGKEHKSGAYEIVTALGSFHGRTLAAVTAGGKARNSDPFTPLPPGFVHVPFNDLEAIKRATTANSVGVMVEPILGSAGVVPAKPEFLRGLREWCDEMNLLLIFDEVQTGLGRTGHWFAFQAYGVQPDILTLAKGLGGGVPIGACLAAPRADTFTPGDHGSTLGGNPLACAAAVTLLNVVEDEGLLANAAEVGSYMRVQLQRLRPTEIRGMGLMIGIDLDRPVAAALQRACFDMGLLINVVGDRTVRFVPPLILTKQDVDTALTILEPALDRVRSGASYTSH